MTMYRKLALGLVAAASLTAAALAPTDASAKGKGWHHHHHGWHGHHHGWHGPMFIAVGYSGCYETRRVWTKYGYRLRTFNVCY
jgi:hypothetical protein